MKQRQTIILASKFTADGNCSHGIKRSVLLGKISSDKLRRRIKKQRDYFANKGLYKFKAMLFPVVIDRIESWAIKKTEHQKMDAFELWYWRRLLRVP